MVTCLALFLFVITHGINLPFVGPYAFNYNIYSLIAHNYNKFGMLSVNFAPIISISEYIPENPNLYLHHPPLLPIIESFFFRVIGESFWAGRLTVIFFAFGSGVLLYVISSLIKNKKFALIVSAIYFVIPASSIFGKMIGQEQLVLFFALFTLLFILVYIRSNKLFYIPIILIGVVLGVLSDWPMVYFILSLSPFLIYKKKVHLLIIILMVAFITALGFFAYISILQSGLHELFGAFINRSHTWEVTPYYLWPFLWAATIFVRFFIYFNPILSILSLFFLLTSLIKLYKHQISSDLLLYFGFFMFGAIHILLYPSGSFGHIYWIYYFIPFICFAVASVLISLEKRKLLLSGIFIFSGIFLLGVDKWKTGEIRGNLWRYDLAQQANKYLSPYEPLLINKDSSLDWDVLKYKFQHEIIFGSPDRTSHLGQYKHYIYSCNTVCNLNEKELSFLLQEYAYRKIQSKQGEGYVFFLDKPAKNFKPQSLYNETKDLVVEKHETTSPQNISFQQVYGMLVKMLQVPFL